MSDRADDEPLAPAEAADLVAIKALLAASRLPSEDLTAAHLRYFWVRRDAVGIAGVVGIEPYASAALLRSLAVRGDRRGHGLGGRLAAHAESQAPTLGVDTLYLLTTTAERFFAARGYVATARNSAPPAIRATREFSDLCPSSSACMSKRLGG